MKKTTPLLLSIVLIFALLFCSCAEAAPSQRSIFAMDTYMTLTAYGENAASALEESVNRIRQLEALLSVTDENSDVWRINHAKGDIVTVSAETAEIIQAALDISGQTGGALDITVYPVVKEWGFTTGEYKIPGSETVARLLEKVDFRQVEINGASVSLPRDFQIDLGALAKGYASDCVAEILLNCGIESALINLGGNIRTVGAKPDGSPWNIAVRDPFDTDENLCVIRVENKTIVTSGNYERYFVGEDGKSYWHIIDPADGYPADNGLVSVTIIGDSGLECDALSTALFAAGTEKAVEYWQDNGGFEMILVTDEGELYISGGIEDSFENLSGMTVHVIEKR